MMSPDEPAAGTPGARRLLGRALRLRCPCCGGGPVVLRWFVLVDSCPGCGLHLDRDEPGYWIGSYTVNLFLTEGVFVLALVAGLALTWPDVPWRLLTGCCVVLTLSFPALVFPFTKLLYLAIDLAFRPPESHDVVTPHERGMVKKGAP